MELKPVNPWKWQDAFGFSQAVEFSGHSRVLTCAGQTSVNAGGEPLHKGDMAAQLYTTDIDACLQHYAVVAERLGKANCRPAITLLQVARLFEPTLMIRDGGHGGRLSGVLTQIWFYEFEGKGDTP